MKFSILASLGVNTKAYQNGLDMAKKQTSSFSKTVRTQLKNIALTFGGVTLAKNILEMGMASKETANMFNTIFADSLDRMKRELKELNRIIPETEISIKENLAVFRQMANGFGITGDKANDFAIQMVKVGADFASFRNIKPDQMFVKMRSAVAGMSRPMMDLGINTQVSMLEQEAFAMGLDFTSGKLTSAQKAFLTLSTTIKQMGEILGDQERTATSTANQYKFLEKKAKDLGARIGEYLLPVFEDLIAIGNKTIDFFERNGEAVKFYGGLVLKVVIAQKAVNAIFKLSAGIYATFSGALALLSGRLLATAKASKVTATGHKVNATATTTATVATSRLNIALMKLRLQMLKLPFGVLIFLLSDYIARVYEASIATKRFAGDVEVDSEAIEKNIQKVVKQIEEYGKELKHSGALDPYEKAKESGKEMIDQTKELSDQIAQYFDLVKKHKRLEHDRVLRAVELKKINAEIAGDKDLVKLLDNQLDILAETLEIAERFGFSLKMAEDFANQLALARRNDPTNKMLKEQEEKTKYITSLEMKLLEAQKSGQEKLAEKIEKRIDAEKRALEIAQKHNITLREAQDLVRGLISAENERSAKDKAKEIIGKNDKGNRNLLRAINEFGREKGISFQREDLGGGRQGFRRFDDGSKGRLYSKDQLMEGVGRQALKAEETGETEVLERIEKLLEGKFVNE